MLDNSNPFFFCTKTRKTKWINLLQTYYTCEGAAQICPAIDANEIIHTHIDQTAQMDKMPTINGRFSTEWTKCDHQ